MRIFVFLVLICSKLLAADNPPFANLNQYYKYKCTDETNFEINQTAYSTEDIGIQSTDSELVIEFRNLAPFRSALTQIEILDKAFRELKTFGINTSANNWSLKLPEKPGDMVYACLVGTNEFSTKRICKKIPSASDKKSAGVLRVSANGIPLEPVGQIILNEKKSKLNFKIENTDFYFELVTSKKNLVINRAYKFEKTATIQTEFIDLDYPKKYGFRRNIGITDTHLEIVYDDLLTVYQDIAFLVPDLFNKSVEYEFKDWKEMKYNKLGIEPVALYSQLTTEASFMNAKLVSQLSKGVRLYQAHYLDNNVELYYAGKILILHIFDGQSQTINNNTLNLMDLSVAARFIKSASLRYDLNLSLEELVFAEKQSTAINMHKAFSPNISLSVNSILIDYQKWRIQGFSGLKLIAPASLPSGQTQIALGLSFGSTLSYKLRAGRLYYGANFSYYNAANSVYKYNYQSLEHTMGFYYLY